MSSRARPASLSFGRFQVVRRRRELLVDGRAVEVGGRAFDVLMVLIEAAGAIVDRDALMRAVWPDRTVEENNLQAQVAALRRVFGADRDLLQTVAGRGYRFTGTVREDAASGTDAPTARTNLPALLSELIGRDAAVRAVIERITAQRLVTLIGTGGVGKTRLATEVGRTLLPRYPDGVWFVDLAPLTDPELVAVTAAAAIGVPLGAGPVTAERVAAALRSNHVLVILDNCEHVIGAAAVLAHALVVGGSLVRVLATSREPLRAPDEHVYRVPSLDVPERNDGDDVSQHGAVQLFTVRARAVEPTYGADRRHAATAAAICRRLDGIPLAIELAASRVAAFGVDGVAARLDDRFHLLTGGRRTALPRQQTLRATLDWSYELLSDVERVVMRRLAVFAGAFSLDAATSVVTHGAVTPSDVMDGVGSLVARSLVGAHGHGATVQYRVLETTRAYAREKLRESGEGDRVLRRHAEHQRDVFERAEPEWETRPRSECLAAYSPLLDDVRAALDWAFSSGGDLETGVRLAIAAAPLWFELSLLEECLGRMERARARVAPGALPPPLEMKLLAALAFALQDTRGAGAVTEVVWVQTLAIAERLGDDEYRVRALWGLFACRNQLALARQIAEIVATRPDGDLRAIADRLIGSSLHYLGDQVSARRHLERMLAEYSGVTTAHAQRIRFLFDQRVVAQEHLAHVLWLQGWPEQARRFAAAALADATASAHPPTLCLALGEAEYAHALYTGDLETMERAASELLDVATRYASAAWQAAARCMRGLLLVKRGDVGAYARLVRPAFDELGESRYFFHYTGFLAALADGLGRAGEVAEARAVIEEAFRRCTVTEENWSMPELLRVKGELLLRDGATDDAEDLFRRALEDARGRGVAGWELRAASSLARLWHAQGRTRQARTLLVPVYRRFTEGLKTADLVSAKALLDTLRS